MRQDAYPQIQTCGGSQAVNSRTTEQSGKHWWAHLLSFTRATKTRKIKLTTNNGLSKKVFPLGLLSIWQLQRRGSSRGKWQEAMTHGNVEEEKKRFHTNLITGKNCDSIKHVTAPIKLNSGKPRKIGLSWREKKKKILVPESPELQNRLNILFQVQKLTQRSLERKPSHSARWIPWDQQAGIAVNS